ncbi:BMP-2-inducible protein kinase-like [Pantherophis guttatus]|uniref:BMP-2-inducible protein kinase-like n=1 Tax=Pantherophis guttatus TaxID=94885 RepID=A0ABM3Z1E2_PANGU|nr:BMP-2-inducible protein kinase-like [Pantherophis guttatus]
MKKFSRMPKSDGTGGSPGGIGGAPAAGGGVGIGIGGGGSGSLSVGSSRVFAVGRFQVTVEEVLAEGKTSVRWVGLRERERMSEWPKVIIKPVDQINIKACFLFV